MRGKQKRSPQSHRGAQRSTEKRKRDLLAILAIMAIKTDI